LRGEPIDLVAHRTATERHVEPRRGVTPPTLAPRCGDDPPTSGRIRDRHRSSPESPRRAPTSIEARFATQGQGAPVRLRRSSITSATSTLDIPSNRVSQLGTDGVAGPSRELRPVVRSDTLPPVSGRPPTLLGIAGRPLSRSEGGRISWSAAVGGSQPNAMAFTWPERQAGSDTSGAKHRSSETLAHVTADAPRAHERQCPTPTRCRATSVRSWCQRGGSTWAERRLSPTPPRHHAHEGRVLAAQRVGPRGGHVSGAGGVAVAARMRWQQPSTVTAGRPCLGCPVGMAPAGARALCGRSYPAAARGSAGMVGCCGGFTAGSVAARGAIGRAAMRTVLDAIARAGRCAFTSQGVIDAFFRSGGVDTVVGCLSVATVWRDGRAALQRVPAGRRSARARGAVVCPRAAGVGRRR
jgi:hypothetical protein